MVFQVRDDVEPRENFQRNWEDYKVGFGDFDREFWLGKNRSIHEVKSQKKLSIITSHYRQHFDISFDQHGGGWRNWKHGEI